MYRLVRYVMIPLFCGIALAGPASFAAQSRGASSPAPETRGVRFAVRVPKVRFPFPLDGRLLLIISSDTVGEPRFLVNDGPGTQIVFGVDVDSLLPGKEAIVDRAAFGFPVHSLADIPKGTYRVQAVLNRYQTYHRSDHHTVKLPPDRGEGQQWNSKPGNFFSTPTSIMFDPSSNAIIRLSLENEIPPVNDPPTTRFIRHERLQSKLLSEFWGCPVYLGAHILLPAGFDEHPNTRYPLVVFHGHFPWTIDDFNEATGDTSTGGTTDGGVDPGRQLYHDWTAPGFPRVIVIEIQHPTPYYDDSYAVNSANDGPYGDAIQRELIPFIEKKYRGIGQGWARFVYGGSTGGWEAMAAQVFYPDEYNGAWICCPDPIDFRAYTVVNIYDDRNAYYIESRWKKTPRPGSRNYLGHVYSTVEEQNHLELVLGSRGRSGEQWDIWQAVYSPVGDDGYPKPIWNKLTGEIDHSVAEYWRDHYDLSFILRRDWKTLGPKLRGKLHIYVGESDTFYLNDAVYLVDEFLSTARDPAFEGEIDYQPRAEHCWTGDHTRPNSVASHRYHQMFIPRILERIRKNSPVGSDTLSWRY